MSNSESDSTPIILQKFLADGAARRTSSLEITTPFGIFSAAMTRVAVGIIRKDGKFLVCQRKKGGRYELKWEFPGGKIEPGETTIECLRRELREELSLQIRSVERMEFETAEYADGGLFEVAYCFIGEFSNEPVNHVFEQIRWVTPQELQQLDILEGNKNFVARLTHE